MKSISWSGSIYYSSFGRAHWGCTLRAGSGAEQGAFGGGQAKGGHRIIGRWFNRVLFPHTDWAPWDDHEECLSEQTPRGCAVWARHIGQWQAAACAGFTEDDPFLTGRWQCRQNGEKWFAIKCFNKRHLPINMVSNFRLIFLEITLVQIACFTGQHILFILKRVNTVAP